MNQRKRYSATQKVEILREHLENQVSISDLARRYGVHPNILYKWKKQLFEGAVESFGTKHQKHVQGQSVRMSQLEEKLKEKDSLIAEIMADNIRLKKKYNGEI